MSIPAPATRRRAKRGQGELLRADILAAAEQLLIKTGDQGAVSIRAIADAAGVTPPSIYLHFADKTELLAAVCEARFADFSQYLRDAVEGIPDPLDVLWAMGRAYVRFGTENPEHYRIMFMTRPPADAPAVPLDRLPGLKAFGFLVEAVARCMDAGAIAAGDAFLVATNLWTAVHGITSLLIARPDFPWPDLDRLMALVVEVHSRGLQALE
jgi:AcrR family transcriptional regulator